MTSFLSFHLADVFVEPYREIQPRWGFEIGGGNALGELIYLSKYSRLKDDGTKEHWFETCRRVVEGTYSILRDHCTQQRTPWNEFKAQKSAQDAYDRMFSFKWMPPGRGLWTMGTALVHEEGHSTPLQNCAFLSTGKLSTHSQWSAVGPFVRCMEMAMWGIGVGADLRGANKLILHHPKEKPEEFIVPDTREGWSESVGVLLESFLFKNRGHVEFDYSLIRDAGSPLKRFGGHASGPQPLIDCHNSIRTQLEHREGENFESRDIADVINKIGKAVQAGGTRRSAQILFGDPDDKDYVNIKNWNLLENVERTGQDGWAWNSNNSVFAESGMEYRDLIDKIAVNGEPGFLWLDLAREYGRMVDPPNGKDYRVMGANPCNEQSLEDQELCTLVETYPIFHDDLEDYKKTLKAAYLYGKAVTLLPTRWAESNEVMARNRRIGCSMSGLAQFVEDRGWITLRNWMDESYQFLTHRDTKYSEWLAVRESIKKTSIKPSGTVSIVAGVTPGIHWPVKSGHYIRRVRYTVYDPIVGFLQEAGYHIEPSIDDPNNTVVVSFPTLGPTMRDERDVSIWEKMELATLAQKYWADNQVSATISFLPEEASQIGHVLSAKDGQLKGISFLPISTEGTVYAQAPYEPISTEVALAMMAEIKPLDFERIYAQGMQAQGEKFCDNETCTLG